VVAVPGDLVLAAVPRRRQRSYWRCCRRWPGSAVGVLLTPATLAGAWVGRKIVGRTSDWVFVLLI